MIDDEGFDEAAAQGLRLRFLETLQEWWEVQEQNDRTDQTKLSAEAMATMIDLIASFYENCFPNPTAKKFGAIVAERYREKKPKREHRVTHPKRDRKNRLQKHQ